MSSISKKNDSKGVARKKRLWARPAVTVKLERNILSKMAQQIKEKMEANQEAQQQLAAATDDVKPTVLNLLSARNRMANLLREKMNTCPPGADPFTITTVDSSSVTIPSPVPVLLTPKIPKEEPVEVIRPVQVVQPVPVALLSRMGNGPPPPTVPDDFALPPIIAPVVPVRIFGNTYKRNKAKTGRSSLNKIKQYGSLDHRGFSESTRVSESAMESDGIGEGVSESAVPSSNIKASTRKKTDVMSYNTS